MIYVVIVLTIIPIIIGAVTGMVYIAAIGIISGGFLFILVLGSAIGDVIEEKLFRDDS